MELWASIEPGSMKVETATKSVEVFDITTLSCFFENTQINSLVQALGTPQQSLKVTGEYDVLYPHLASRN